MLIAAAQLVAGAFSWVMVRLFCRLEVRGIEHLSEINRPFLVVTNHESHLDPQLIALVLLSRPGLFPLRFMAKNDLFYYPIFGQLIWLLGAFKAHKKQGIGKSLLTPTKILEQKGNVIMFPEGRIIPERPKLGEGRRGAAILALTTRAQLLPMALHTPANLNPFKFIFTRPKIVVTVGEPFYLNNLDFPDFSDQNTFAATELIMSKISALYYQHRY